MKAKTVCVGLEQKERGSVPEALSPAARCHRQVPSAAFAGSSWSGGTDGSAALHSGHVSAVGKHVPCAHLMGSFLTLT